ncbi:hypothetical protein ACIRD3_39685, partial [Kitasatospora sp. NPDC093550]|uniref:hypothetical protein n=1 Tax=Kitasatospora sp. NPDC093550 TaxID=3364089 RepID=UPI00381CC2E5
AARFHGRRALAALAAAPLGLLSMLLSWPMRKLGLASPQWGRRVYRRLVGAALTARQQRDQQVHQDADQAAAQDQQQPAAQAEEDTVQLRKLDRVSDAPLDTDTTTPAADAASIYQGDLMGLFDFRGAAEDMHTQAQQGEISGMLAVLRSIETMPDAITYIANTFGVVAERLSPEEAPLDPAVTDSLMEVYGLLVKAADAASEVAEVFKKKHEPEIQRLEDPRVGEEMWDVTRNNDVEEDV